MYILCTNIISEEEKMFCRKCGKELDDSAIACPECGAPVKPRGKAVSIWAIVMAFIIPVVGFILGFIAVVKGIRYRTTSVLITGICAILLSVVLQIIYFVYFGHKL